MPKTVPEMLRQSADTYEERNLIYGDNYLNFGTAMLALFPDGITIETKTDWNRLGILVQMVAKLTRYGQQFNNGGHDDSLLDLTTYTAMLREIDAMQQDEPIPFFDAKSFSEQEG